MLTNFQMPPSALGPGSQPSGDDAQDLDYMPLPSGMRTFEAHLPEVPDTLAMAPALALLGRIATACDAAHTERCGASFDMSQLDRANRALVAETMGEGEVACIFKGDHEIRAQESVFAGVWTVQGPSIDRIEVAPIPRDVSARAASAIRPAIGTLATRKPGVANAPAIVTELMDKSREWRPGALPHVVNLSLMPHTPEDLEFLDVALGEGSIVILSRGYGNCRVTATGLAHVWRVQFFNSMDNLILDMFEVTDVPEVATAAAEDFEDSAQRLREVVEAVR